MILSKNNLFLFGVLIADISNFLIGIYDARDQMKRHFGKIKLCYQFTTFYASFKLQGDYSKLLNFIILFFNRKQEDVTSR